jgi:hypothetical protein
MEKAKVNKLEFEALEKLKGVNRKKVLSNYIKGDGFSEYMQNRLYRAIYAMKFDELVKALYIGYELDIPYPPSFRGDNLQISFNEHNIESIRKNPSFFIKWNCDYIVPSPKEARYICDSLSKLLAYYDEFINKK